MLNLIDARSRDPIVSRANASKIFDISVDYFVGMPSWDKASDPCYQIWIGEQVTDHMRLGWRAQELVSYSFDVISMYIHCGTHIDTMNHFGYRREIDNHFKTHGHIGQPHQGCVRPRSSTRLPCARGREGDRFGYEHALSRIRRPITKTGWSCCAGRRRRADYRDRQSRGVSRGRLYEFAFFGACLRLRGATGAPS
jgi:hypothetical protein